MLIMKFIKCLRELYLSYELMATEQAKFMVKKYIIHTECLVAGDCLFLFHVYYKSFHIIPQNKQTQESSWLSAELYEMLNLFIEYCDLWTKINCSLKSSYCKRAQHMWCDVSYCDVSYCCLLSARRSIDSSNEVPRQRERSSDHVEYLQGLREL